MAQKARIGIFLSGWLTIAFLFSCKVPESPNSDPDYNPYVLKKGKYVLAPENIRKDSLIRVSGFFPAKGTYFEAKQSEVILSQTAELLNKPFQPGNNRFRAEQLPLPPNGRVINMDSVEAPDNIPARKDEMPSSWPSWSKTLLDQNHEVSKNISYLNVKEGLNNRWISALLETRSGDIWIGTNSGISVWDGTGLSLFTRAEGMSSNDIKAIMEDRNGNIWIGTYLGGLNMWDGRSFIHFNPGEDLGNSIVWSILEDREGKIWIATLGNGVYIWDGNGFIHYDKKKRSG